MAAGGEKARAVVRPRPAALPPLLGSAARGIAERLAGAGHRAWLVGGAVRDLALGRTPAEIDMASAAAPEEVERLFRSTLPVGRAFGTVIVRWPEEAPALDVQLTTFRTESGYSDARRPDRVAYGSSPEEDAQRRDFTCNALYLDPLDGTFLDPTGGIPDLERSVLRAVGDARRRFDEDGLRLLRLARFAAALELEPAPDVLAAACERAAALRGVSPERVLAELAAVLERPGAARAFEWLERTGILVHVLPALGRLGAGERAARRRALDALPQPAGLAPGLAVLLEPGERGLDEALATADALHVPGAVRRRLKQLWSARRAVERAAADPAGMGRAERLRVLRDDAFADALALARAWRAAAGRAHDDLERLAEEHARTPHAALFPAPLVEAADLAAAGLAPGPEWGAILAEAETLQLDGGLADRDAALRWLAARVARAQEGGKTPRST